MDRNGTVVAFTSSATNLVAGDGNGKTDVFVRTLGSSPSTSLVSVATGGSAPGNDASDAAGRHGHVRSRAVERRNAGHSAVE